MQRILTRNVLLCFLCFSLVFVNFIFRNINPLRAQEDFGSEELEYSGFGIGYYLDNSKLKMSNSTPILSPILSVVGCGNNSRYELFLSRGKDIQTICYEYSSTSSDVIWYTSDSCTNRENFTQSKFNLEAIVGTKVSENLTLELIKQFGAKFSPNFKIQFIFKFFEEDY